MFDESDRNGYELKLRRVSNRNRSTAILGVQNVPIPIAVFPQDFSPPCRLADWFYLSQETLPDRLFKQPCQELERRSKEVLRMSNLLSVDDEALEVEAPLNRSILAPSSDNSESDAWRSQSLLFCLIPKLTQKNKLRGCGHRTLLLLIPRFKTGNLLAFLLKNERHRTKRAQECVKVVRHRNFAV